MKLVPRKNRGQYLSPFESIFDDFWNFPSVFNDSSSGMYMPKVDLSEGNKSIDVVADLPGYKKDDVEVSIDDSVLTISGSMKEESEEKDKKYYCKQCSSGSFHHSIALPSGADEDAASCKMDNGKLKISIPKKQIPEQSGGKRLEIE